MCLCRRMHCDMSPWSHWTATGHLIKKPHQGTINWNQSWVQIRHDNTCNPEVLLHPILHVIDTSRLCLWTKCLTSSSYQTISRFHRLPVLSVLLADTTSGNGHYWKLFKYFSLFGQHMKILWYIKHVSCQMIRRHLVKFLPANGINFWFLSGGMKPETHNDRW